MMALYRRILSAGYNGTDLCLDVTCVAVVVSPPTAVANNHHRSLSNFLFIGAAIFAISLLLSLTYYAVLRRRRRLCGLLHPPAVPSPATGRAAAPPSDDDDTSIEDGEPVHHVWYIRTVGLDEATIDSINVAEYKTSDPLLGVASDCTVCLGEFCDGELVRLLPKCGHAFHVPCIDTWLRAHVSCPLCRALIVDPNVERPKAAVAPPDTGGLTTDLTSDSSALQIGVQPLEEEQTRDRVETVIEIGIPVNPTEVLDSPPESSLSRMQSDMGECGLQPVRRSVSMDFMDAIAVSVEAEEGANGQTEGKFASFDEENVPKNRGRQGITSKGVSDRKSHLEIERSLSSSDRGFFFSRHGRVSRNYGPSM